MLVPTEEICFSICACAPSPIDIITITEPTPMMMPSMVSRRAHRIGEQRLAAEDVATPNFMSASARAFGSSGCLRCLDFDLAVPEMDLARGVLGDFRLVGDDARR